MDEFLRDIDPIDEYAPITQDADNSVDETAKINTQEVATQACETVTVDTADEDDTFEAFDKAQSTAPAYSQPVSPAPPVAPTQPVAPPYNPPYTAPQPQQVAAPQYVPVQPQNGGYAPYQPVSPYQPQQVYQAPRTVYQPPKPTKPTQPVNAQYTAPQPPAYTQQNYQYANRNPQQPPRQAVPYTQPNPYYIPQAPQNPPQPPRAKTPARTKVLIGILIALLVIFMLSFFVSCSMLTSSDSNKLTFDNPLSGYATEPEYDEFYDDYGTSPYFDFGPSYQGDYFKEDVVLQADEGQTQERDEDLKNNTFAPDKDAKGIEIKALPKDKDNKKYTTQSAYNAVTDSVVSITCYEDKITLEDEDIIGEGTGTLISSDGYIVTNSHVIGDTKAYKINVTLNNGDEYGAKIVGYDSRTDLAVLKIDAKNLSYAEFSDSSLVEVGQDIVAIGNPGGASFQNSLTKGIVSAVERELELGANVTYIQIDAAINPGNSGGPLCNIYGQVIGINTAKISAEEYEGMGFAIPSNKVAQIANDLIHYGYVKDRVRLGLMGREVDEEMIYNYNVPYGVLITEISEGGPLDNTDIELFDIITEINGVEVSSFQEVFSELEKYKPNEKVTLTLYRLEE